MKLKRLIIIALIFIGSSLFAQEYEQAIGLRLSSAPGITYKHAMDRNTYIEGLLYMGENYMYLAGIYEIYGVAFETDGLYWYYGGGAHLGGGNSNGAIGVNGIIGLEYVFKEAPLNLSVDWNPALNILGDFGFYFYSWAISLRYNIY